MKSLGEPVQLAGKQLEVLLCDPQCPFPVLVSSACPCPLHLNSVETTLRPVGGWGPYNSGRSILQLCAIVSSYSFIIIFMSQNTTTFCVLLPEYLFPLGLLDFYMIFGINMQLIGIVLNLKTYLRSIYSRSI